MTTTKNKMNTLKFGYLKRAPDWELKAIVKALSLPSATWFNTDDDEARLELAEKILRLRRSQRE